jgi:hypothetical protein
MKGIFWNSRGLSDLAKARFLRDTSRLAKLRFYRSFGNMQERFLPEYTK